MSINNPYEFFVQLHLTERCNLSCSHCYQDGSSSSDEMSLPEIRSVIEEVSDMLQDWTKTYGLAFTSSFNVTGGEPFLRQDLFPILEALKDRGFDTYLLTNGTLIDRDRAAALAGQGLKGVQISIEGPEEVHDAIRGRGSFSASLKGIRNLLDADLEVTLNATLSGMNAPYFMEVIELASSLGVQRLGFSRLVPSGSGMKLLDSMLGKEVLKELYTKIFSVKTNGLTIVTGDPVASQFRMPSEADGPGARPSGGCAAGVSGLTILPDGTVTPCRRLPAPLGNVRQDSLREIWASSAILNSLRDKSGYEGKCGSCGVWSSCRGCRAIAYAYSKTDNAARCLAEDPQCYLTP
ncbi:MAG: radical SAM protein [Thermodesulfovibrionales bacterium]